MRSAVQGRLEPLAFDAVVVGQEVPLGQYGPFTIADSVRWAGLQENWQHLHYDRDHVRVHNGLPTFIASGAYRLALLSRSLTDRAGPRGRLRSLAARQVHPTFEGDLLRFSGTVTGKHDDAEPYVELQVVGRNQDDREVLAGTAAITLTPDGEGWGS